MVEYARNHLIVSDFAQARDYGSPRESRARLPPRERVAHANRLASQLLAAQQAMSVRDIALVPGFSADDAAALLEVESAPGIDLPELARKKIDVRVGNVRQLPNGAEQAVLVMPSGSMTFFSNAVIAYRDEDTEAGWPKQRTLIEPIETIRPGWLEDLWTDPRPIPEGDQLTWWECWCWPDRTETLRRAAGQLRLRVSEGHLFFPEMTVLPVYARRGDIERIIASIDAIGELRRATDSPRFFMHDVVHEQGPWVNNLIDRVTWPTAGAPSVCLLDSGVNREHPLIEPALLADDVYAFDSDWGTADDHDHGTYMAGLALFGDLTPLLASEAPVTLQHRLESVKLVEPPGVDRHDPESYGVITQAAMAIPESKDPHRIRNFCLAMSNEDVSGERPSSWSSAIDQSAAGAATGDQSDEDDDIPRRLIIVAAGNVPDTATLEENYDTDEFPIEDPAQAWNALTIGGFTDLVTITEPDLDGWQAMAEVGQKSPYSRASTDWPHSATAIKPELVFEAGNRALSPNTIDISSGVDSLSVLTTGSRVEQRPLDTFWATSASVAQAARMAAMIQARYPSAWPETIRALMVHSAQWSPAMLEELLAVPKLERKLLLRCFGYGIPDLRRALDSADNDLALIAEATIKPYRRETGKGIKFCHAHFYELPWPTAELENLGNIDVHLKVTLSYFIEPNPGQYAPVAAHRYRSAGLRFANKRAGEPLDDFYRRVNRLDRDGADGPEAEHDPRWILGPTAISAGSLHTDVWIGPAIELADRKHIAVMPVMGWWRDRVALNCYEREMRYTLVVSLASPEQDVPLYAEVRNAIEAAVTIDIET